MKYKDITKRFFCFFVTLTLLLTMPIVATATENNIAPKPEMATTRNGTIIYNRTVSIPANQYDMYWGDSVTAPESGYYKIYYAIEADTSSGSIEFNLNGVNIASTKGSVSSMVKKYYSKDSSISFGVGMTATRAYGISIIIETA